VRSSHPIEQEDQSFGHYDYNKDYLSHGIGLMVRSNEYVCRLCGKTFEHVPSDLSLGMAQHLYSGAKVNDFKVKLWSKRDLLCKCS
jgi:hypothetical protein